MASGHLEILNLMHLYAHRFDEADFEGFADLFENGTVDLGVDRPLSGAAEVLRFVRERVILYDGSPRTNHLMHNPVIQVDEAAGTATAQSYVQILQGVPGHPIEVIATGRYADRFVADSGGWRFAERTGRGSLYGDFSRHLRPVRS
jgi:hypothetical protein